MSRKNIIFLKMERKKDKGRYQKYKEQIREYNKKESIKANVLKLVDGLDIEDCKLLLQK